MAGMRFALVLALALLGCNAIPEDSQRKFPVPTNGTVEMPEPLATATAEPSPTPSPIATTPRSTPSPVPSRALDLPPYIPPPQPTRTETATPAPAPALSCTAQIGFNDAAYLSRQCSVVSGESCSAEQSCSSLRAAIREGCAADPAPPGFCRR